VEQEGSLSSLLQESSAEIGFPLNSEQVQLFMAYLQQLQTWNQSFNLTSITVNEEIVIKHFVDSLAALIATDIEVGSQLLDVGTGAGFPGIPLKIVRPDLRITLLEPAKKKSSFLHFIVGLLRLERVDICDIPLNRFIGMHHVKKSFDYITTRALNPALVLREGRSVVRQGGRAILYSSQSIEKSYDFTEWRLINEYTFDLPGEYGHRTISIFSLAS
jgi:16S rRNA (guanine527-N7)-methyltransferase